MNTKLLLSTKTSSALRKLDKFLATSQFAGSRYFILVDENTSEHCLPLLITQVEALQEAEFLEIESGEGSKTLDIAKELWETLIESETDRNTVLVNLGGGVITDLGGFIAAGLKRGIRYINIPTSLLGMVDASVGGKTGVDINRLKNQIGFFYPPIACCIDSQFLDTLPEAEVLSGLGEVLKTALIDSKETWNSVYNSFAEDNGFLKEEVITACAQFKKKITDQDTQEKGLRKILNFGHTIGHAIESFQMEKENPVSHGHAVAWGMVYELYLSVKKLNFPQQDFDQIVNLIRRIFPMQSYTKNEAKQLYALMKHDKKNSQGRVNGVLLKNIGEPVVDVEITENDMQEAIAEIRK